MTAKASVHLALKEFTWTVAKSCDKIFIQNLYLSCRIQQHCQQHFLRLVVNGATRNAQCATFPHFKFIAYTLTYLEVRTSLFTFGI